MCRQAGRQALLSCAFNHVLVNARMEAVRYSHISLLALCVRLYQHPHTVTASLYVVNKQVELSTKKCARCYMVNHTSSDPEERSWKPCHEKIPPLSKILNISIKQNDQWLIPPPGPTLLASIASWLWDKPSHSLAPCCTFPPV